MSALVQAGYRFAFSLTHHKHDAEDLVQQACLRVIRARGRLATKKYLFVTIRNLFFDAGRRRALASFDRLDADTTNALPSKVCQIECKLDVETVLSTLPAEARELIYLNCIEGFTAQEIADVTGKPRGTILSQLARTKQELTKRYQSGREEKAMP